jgi:hypothetical protein
MIFVWDLEELLQFRHCKKKEVTDNLERRWRSQNQTPRRQKLIIPDFLAS